MIDDKLELEVRERLKKIEGQLRGIRKMIHDRRYCMDVVMQMAAAEAALHKVAAIVLRNHIETCVLEAFRTRDRTEVRTKIDELMRVYHNLRPR